MLENSNRGSGREVTGIIIIIIGFGLLMNTMNFFPHFPFVPLLHRFWMPALFIGIGALLISRRRGQEGMGPGLFFILLGFFFLIGGLDSWGFGFRRWIGPAILIWIGVALLMRSQRPRREFTPGDPPPGNPPGSPPGSAAGDLNDRFENRSRGRRDFPRPEQYTDSSDFIHATVILGAFNRRCPSQQFRGGDLTAIMGGGKIDLRDARIQEKEAVLDVFTLMGGLEIQVPEGWVVEPRFTPILGGYQDRTSRATQGTQRLVINGTAIMGGITVFN